MLIIDDDGNLVYKSRAFSQNAAAFSLAAEKAILSKAGSAALRKDVTVDGRVYSFYLQAEHLRACCGMEASAVADRLFDVARITEGGVVKLSLSVLAQRLEEVYAAFLRSHGVHLELRGLVRPWCVAVVPDALLLCLALMIRLCAYSGKHVRLSAVRTGERVTVFVDAAVGEGRAEIPTVLSALLYETAAEVGFAVEHCERNGRVTWSLALSPVDVGQLGFKTHLPKQFWNTAKLYALLLL